MAPRTEDSGIDWERMAARMRHQSREECPPPAPKKDVSHDDIAAVGGQFSEGEFRDRRDSYESQLEVSEDEEALRRSRSFLRLDPPPARQSRRQSGSPLGRLASIATPTRAQPRAHLNAYIELSDLELLPHRRSHSMRNRNRRNRTIRQRSQSPNGTSSSDSPPSMTTADEPNDEVNNEDRERTPTAFDTPPHTPSQRSVATTEEHESPQRREPASPYPYNPIYHPYNDQHVKNVLEHIENIGNPHDGDA